MDRTLIASGACPRLHTACGSWPRGPEPRFQTRAVPRAPSKARPLEQRQPQTHGRGGKQPAARAAAAHLPIPTRGRRTSRHACQPPRHVRPPRPSPRCCSGSRAPTPRRPRRPGGGRLGGRGRRRTSDEDAPPPPRLTATALRALRYTARAPNPLFLL